jgi:hypothetical protein
MKRKVDLMSGFYHKWSSLEKLDICYSENHKIGKYETRFFRAKKEKQQKKEKMRKALHLFGRAFRETGQALDRFGLKYAEQDIYKETFSRHRPVMNLFDKVKSLFLYVFHCLSDYFHCLDSKSRCERICCT